MSKRILVIEDDSSLARVITDNLAYEGFLTETASTGPDALERIRSSKPDLVLLDIMLPGLDGFEVCRRLNAEHERVAIIIITARTQQGDKIRGFELGADDYVAKPFALRELLARIHAVLRRTQPPVRELSLGDVSVDFTHSRAWRGGEPLTMTAREHRKLLLTVKLSGSAPAVPRRVPHPYGVSATFMTKYVISVPGSSII